MPTRTNPYLHASQQAHRENSSLKSFLTYFAYGLLSPKIGSRQDLHVTDMYAPRCMFMPGSTDGVWSVCSSLADPPKASINAKTSSSMDVFEDTFRVARTFYVYQASGKAAFAKATVNGCVKGRIAEKWTNPRSSSLTHRTSRVASTSVFWLTLPNCKKRERT